jgi:hypothetical protein
MLLLEILSAFELCKSQVKAFITLYSSPSRAANKYYFWVFLLYLAKLLGKVLQTVHYSIVNRWKYYKGHEEILQILHWNCDFSGSEYYFIKLKVMAGLSHPLYVFWSSDMLSFDWQIIKSAFLCVIEEGLIMLPPIFHIICS